jgi:hypothetical protein
MFHQFFLNNVVLNGNPGLGLRQTQKGGGVKQVDGISNNNT